MTQLLATCCLLLAACCLLLAEGQRGSNLPLLCSGVSSNRSILISPGRYVFELLLDCFQTVLVFAKNAGFDIDRWTLKSYQMHYTGWA